MIASRPGLVLIRGMFVFLAHFGGPLKYAKRASFPALVIRVVVFVVVFLEDGEDGGLASTLFGDGDMTTRDGCVLLGGRTR